MLRLGAPLGVFAASRAAVFGVLFLALRLPGSPGASRFLTGWDGAWYLEIARSGYPKALAAAPGQSDHAFFPLYPLAIRGVHAIGGWSWGATAVALGTVATAAAMVVIWSLVERLTDAATASRAVALMSFFPWAFVFSLAYSEGFLLLLAGICLLALLDEHWVVAGLAAGLAGAARPNGFVLALPCAWAALVAIRRRRDWRALAAPALAPLGILGFFAYLGVRTGDVLANLHARSRGWAYDGIGFFHHPRAVAAAGGPAPSHPLARLDHLTSYAAIGVIAVALVLMILWRPPAILWFYVVPVVALALWYDTYVSMGRFALGAFPLIVALARPVKGPAFFALIGASAALMATLFVVSGSTVLLTP